VGVRGIFSRGGQIRIRGSGSGRRKSPSRFSGGAPVGVWGKAPKSWRSVLKIMHKYFVYWDFRQHLLVTCAQKHFTIFPRGSNAPPLPMPAGVHTNQRTTLTAFDEKADVTYFLHLQIFHHTSHFVAYSTLFQLFNTVTT